MKLSFLITIIAGVAKFGRVFDGRQSVYGADTSSGTIRLSARTKHTARKSRRNTTYEVGAMRSVESVSS